MSSVSNMNFTLLLLLFAFCKVSADLRLPLTNLLRRSNRPCDKNEDCTTANSYCYKSSMCLCKDGFIAVNQNKTSFICIEAAKTIGDHCILNIQCEKALGTLAVCDPRSSESVGNCSCQQGSHFKDGQCYRTSRLGEKCVVHNNCRISSSSVKVYCTRGHDHKGICVCPPGYHSFSNGTDCSPTSGLGGECTSDEACTSPNTKCFGRCACKEKYILNENKNRCLPISSGLYSSCIEDVQCSFVVNNSVCERLRKKCVCSERWSLEKNGTCFPSVRLDEPCINDDECRSGSESHQAATTCEKGYCQCVKSARRLGMECVLEKSIIAGYGGSASENVGSFLLLISATLMTLRPLFFHHYTLRPI